MNTPKLSLLVQQQPVDRLCQHPECGKPEGDHANNGRWCPDLNTHWFSPSRRFKFVPALDWRAGDAYMVLKYEGLNVIGIVESVSPNTIRGWEVATNSDGTFVSFQLGAYERDEMTRLVPA